MPQNIEPLFLSALYHNTVCIVSALKYHNTNCIGLKVNQCRLRISGLISSIDVSIPNACFLASISDNEYQY